MSALQHEVFVRHLNSKFRILTSEAETIEAELTEVSERKLSLQHESFSIVFRGSNGTFLGQGMRRFEHDQIEPFDLFIVPIGRDEKGTYYEAVFNRVRGEEQLQELK